MSLKDLIKDNHDKAEQHAFVKALFGGKITPEIYADLVYNKLFCYTVLEEKAMQEGLLEGIESLCRAAALEWDYVDIMRPAQVHQATVDYVNYLNTVPKEKLMGHIYANHFGDLYGGQMIKKVVPGSSTAYDFEDRAGLIKKIRERLSDDLGDEANRAIEFNLKLFDELADAHNIPAA
jgi:heme oxygenase